MGLTLTNEQIDLTYPGLIKMNDNVAVSAVLKPLSDGVGNNLPIEVSTTGINFTGTVTGIPPGGLVSGTGSDSMQSAAFLTTTPADANGGESIALGNGAVAGSLGIAIGPGTQSLSGPTICIGRFASASGSVSMGLGNGASVSSDQSIGISGEVTQVSGARSIAIGRQTVVQAINAISIGNYARTYAPGGMTFTSCRTNVSSNFAEDTIMMVPGQYGGSVNVGAVRGIVMGATTLQTERLSSIAVNAGAIGFDTIATQPGAFAIGDSVSAGIAQTVSVKELETQTVGGGITMYSPNGTGYKLTVSDAGAPVFTAI